MTALLDPALDAAVCRRLGLVPPAITFLDLAGPEPELLPLEPAALPGPVDPIADPLPDPVAVEAHRAACAFARAFVEGLGGRRSPAQFGDLVAARVVSVIMRRAAADRGLAPYRPASLRLQLLSPRTAEVCVRLVRDGFSSALAFRLDRRRGAWRCTALVVG